MDNESYFTTGRTLHGADCMNTCEFYEEDGHLVVECGEYRVRPD